ncbi:MAG: phage protease [Pseudotabrizicola sp.]|uniref:phage protease n=1 Tax=Pseudotabrizicola sp. TaxID=2939647 RepID=UPI00271AD34A|nr:phage protease [Pseudotabrizicola sp.]MDO9639683.1 phage protease [Pseudotabrizicola sp.]
MTPRTHTSLSPVLMASDPASQAAPEWIHLLPTANGPIQTDDNRGPYHVEDADAIIAASFADTDRLPIDQNHSTDLAAPKGLPSPASGWIVDMQARADGIWGRVEWTREGAAMVADRAYRAISPVVLHDKAKTIFAVLRASLVNRPNFKGLTALNSPQEETTMDNIAEALGLKAGASEEDILAAIASSKNKKPEGGAAMQASLQAANDAVTALQATVTEQATQINALTEGSARREAEAFVDQAIADKRAGLNASTRAHYVSMHMADATMAKTTIESLPKLGPSGMGGTPPAVLKEGEISLNASQVEAAKLLGIPTKDYTAQLKAEAEKEAS